MTQPKNQNIIAEATKMARNDEPKTITQRTDNLNSNNNGNISAKYTCAQAIRKVSDCRRIGRTDHWVCRCCCSSSCYCRFCVAATATNLHCCLLDSYSFVVSIVLLLLLLSYCCLLINFHCYRSACLSVRPSIWCGLINKIHSERDFCSKIKYIHPSCNDA